jgi:hypothetical protein
MIPENTKETLWDLYHIAYRRISFRFPTDTTAAFLAKESINAILKYDNYPMAVELAIHAEIRDNVWLDYAWLLQVEYAAHINNVYTAKPLSTKIEYASIDT